MENLEILKKYCGRLAESLEENLKTLLSKTTEYQVEIVTAKDGNTLVTVTKDSKLYRLNSIYRPVLEAEKWASQFEERNIDAVYFLFGLGNGLILRELMKRGRKDTIYIVYEPSIHIFSKVMDSVDLTDILANEKLHLIVKGLNDDEMILAIEKSIFWANLDFVHSCEHPVYSQVFPEEKKEFDRIVLDGYIRAKANVNTAVKFQNVFTPNTLYSLSILRENYLLYNAYEVIDQTVPAIIVSAGPSLEKNIDDLHLAKGKSYIIATDRSIPLLLKHDVIPDFTISIDPKKWANYYNDSRSSVIPMFCLFESKRLILEEKHIGKKIFCDSSEYPKIILKQLGKSTSTFSKGGSVATAAMNVCLFLGLEKVILVGQDLAYLGEKTHAGKVTSGEKENGGRENQKYVEGIDGKQILTRADWYRYLDWFEYTIRTCPRVHVIDATEGGAKIHGSEIMTLKEAIETYCTKEIDVASMMEHMEPALNEEEAKRVYDYVDTSAKELALVKERLRHSIKDCERLMKACRGGSITLPKYNKPIKELSKTNQYIEQTSVYKLLDSLVTKDATETLKEIYIQSDDPNENLRKTFEQSHDFYKALYEAGEKLQPMIEEALERMRG